MRALAIVITQPLLYWRIFIVYWRKVYSNVLWETDQNGLVSSVLTNTTTSQSSRTTEEEGPKENETIATKSHKHDLLNMTQTPIDILTWKVKTQEASTLDTELQAATELWKKETQSFSGKRAPVSHIIPNVTSDNIPQK